MAPWTNMRIDFSNESDYGWFVEYDAELEGVRIGYWEFDKVKRRKVESDSIPTVPAELSEQLTDTILKVVAHEELNK